MAFWLDYFTAPWRRHSDLRAEITRLQWRTDFLEESLMARVDDVVARLAAATDELARDLESVRTQLAEQDSELAARLEPMVARLEQMGADPNDPVPGSEPSTGPEVPAGEAGTGDEMIVNPTPGASDNPNG